MIADGGAPEAAAGSTTRAPQSTGGALWMVVLAIVGHACALGLIYVRPYAVFQHYRPWQWIAAERPLAACGVLAQAVIVGALTWRFRERFRQVFAGLLSVRACLLILALAGFSLAVPTVSVSRSLGEIILAGGLALISLLNLVLAVLMLPHAVMARIAEWVDARVTLHPGAAEVRPWDRWLPAAVAIWVTLLAAATSYVVLERVPHIDDGVSYLFQAKYFAAGHLYLPAPPDAESFVLDLTVSQNGKWFGYAFPGWPAVLAIGALAGVPWLVNPVLAGLLILIGHAWLGRRFDRGTANAAVLMLTVSSWLIFMSAEFMGHPLTAVLLLLALLAFDRASERAGGWLVWAVVTGAAIGALMLTRAFDGILAAVTLGIVALIDRRLVRAWPAIVVAALAAAAVTALIFPYNTAVTGRATYPPHEAWADGRYGPGVDVLGFGPNVGIRLWPNLDPLPGHGLADVILNLNKNLFMVNVDLFGWAPGSLLFILLALGLGRWRRDDAIVLAVPAVYAVGYSAFWFSGGPDLGARYWYPIVVPLAALAVRGAQMTSAQLERKGALSHAGARVGAVIMIASVSAAFVMLPWRATTKHYRYRGISAEVRELAATHQFGNALVFVQGDKTRRDYQAAFNFNPPTLGNRGTIYAFDAGPVNRAAVVAHFSDRPVWVIGRVPVAATGTAPLRVIVGPLAPGTVPR